MKVKLKSLSHVQLFVTPWTVAYQAPQSMEFPRQEYWSGLPFPSPGDLPNPGIEPRSRALQADALPSEPSKTKILGLSNQAEDSLSIRDECCPFSATVQPWMIHITSPSLSLLTCKMGIIVPSSLGREYTRSLAQGKCSMGNNHILPQTLVHEGYKDR